MPKVLLMLLANLLLLLQHGGEARCQLRSNLAHTHTHTGTRTKCAATTNAKKFDN